MPFISSVRGSFGPQSRLKRNFNPGMLAGITGGSITTAGGYRIHSFTSTGASSFTTNIPLNIEILMIAGGGGGGSIGGGGGAGGYIYGSLSAPSGTNPLNIGAGGSRSPSGHGSNIVGTQGGNTTGFGLTAIGGGFGCGWASWIGNSGAGGSSGGGTGPSSASPASQPSQPAVAGITQIGHRGDDGGAVNDNYGNTGSPNHQGAGGGGAGTAGFGRGGGQGLYSSITGTSVGRGGGGGGGVHTGVPNQDNSFSTTGEPWGGARGQGNNDTTTRDGVANTGGGGGGAFHTTDNPAGGGGSGIIVVRYQI